MAKGLKINNTTSNVKAPPVVDSKALEEAAAEVAKKLEEYKSRSWDLGIKFKSILESSVLVENKSILIKDFENEVTQSLCQLASDINTDETQLEGSGSVALCQLMMKMMIYQKDIINQLKYKVEVLEKKIQKEDRDVNS